MGHMKLKKKDPLPASPRKPVTLAPRSRLRRPPALSGRQANCSNHFRKSAAYVMATQVALLDLSPINGSTKQTGPAGLCFLY